MRYLLFAAALLLTGCETPEETAAGRAGAQHLTKASLESPVEVGVLPNQQTVKYVKVYQYRPNRSSPDEHHVYFVDGVATTNWEEQVGKTTADRVVVNIRPTMTEVEIIELATKLQAEREQKEREEWQRLSKKFNQPK